MEIFILAIALIAAMLTVDEGWVARDNEEDHKNDPITDDQ